MKLPVLSGPDVVKILSKIGFGMLGQKGSHVILVRKVGDQKFKPIIPMHKELKKGTLLSIIRQAGLSKEEFLKVYSEL